MGENWKRVRCSLKESKRRSKREEKRELVKVKEQWSDSLAFVLARGPNKQGLISQSASLLPLLTYPLSGSLRDPSEPIMLFYFLFHNLDPGSHSVTQ